MYDTARGDYVCLRDQVVRHVPVPSVPVALPIEAPLPVLVVMASPSDRPPVDVSRERGQLEQALGPLVQQGLVSVDWLEQAGWADLQEALMRRPCHCLHFIGHGNFDDQTDQGVLALVGRDGRADLVEASRFVSLLRSGRPMPRLVVLNSCLGAAGGAGDLFAGTAPTLVRGGVSAVVAMQYEITDTAAAEFSRGFYAGVARGRGLEAAVAAGRLAVLGLGRTLEWVTPVIYLRGDNPQVFTIIAPTSHAGDNQASALGRAEGLRAERRWADAEAAFREAIELGAGTAVAHFGWGDALWALGRVAEAEAAFREAIRLAPSHVAPRCGLGSALRDQHRPGEAEAAFRAAIELAPDYAAAHYGLGSALRDQRRPVEAEAAFREAIQLDPGRPLAYRGLGHALGDQGRQDEARACYREEARRVAQREAQRKNVRGATPPSE